MKKSYFLSPLCTAIKTVTKSIFLLFPFLLVLPELLSQPLLTASPTSGNFGTGTGVVTIPVNFGVTSNQGNQNGVYTVTASITVCPPGNTCSFVGCLTPAITGNNETVNCSGTLTVTGTANGVVSGTFGASTNGGGANPIPISFSYNALLPVALTAFKVEKIEREVELYWETASETNNEVFVVEHSKDGNQFQAIGKIAGAGTSNQPRLYSFFHGFPVPGYNFYRLKQVDFDGNFEYSPVRSVLFLSQNQVEVFPTVTRDFIQVLMAEAPEEKAQIMIFSSSGSLVSSQEIDQASNFSFDLSPFPSGQYVAKVIAGRQVSNFKVVKID